MSKILESLQVFIDWLYDCFVWLTELPYKIVVYLFDLWSWLLEEILVTSCKYILDGLSYLAKLGGYNLTRPTEQLHELYQTLNYFFPLDEVVYLGVFLLQTYLLTKMFGLMWLAGLKYLKPRDPFGGNNP